MKNCSLEYLSSINQPIRNSFLVKATLGVVNLDAQSQASLSADGFVYSSNDIFDDTDINYPYASFEKDYTSADGLMYFPSEEGYEDKFNGFVSESISDANRIINTTLMFTFSDDILPLDIKGLTLDFGNVYPTEFKVVWDNGEKTYSNNAEKFETNDVFFGVNQMQIVVTMMNMPFTRFRMKRLTFGIGVLFDDTMITNLEFKHSTNPISNALPTMDLSFTIINRDYEYDLENPSSTINFLEETQECQVSFGYELPSKTQWFKICTGKLKSWSSKQYSAEFKFTDMLAFYNADYIKGTYSDSGRSLYDLAIDVLTDMGLESDQYGVDDYFKTVITHNPIPICSHPEALQMIANAGRGYITYDSDGVLMVQANFIPDYEFSSDNKMAYSNVSLLKNGCFNHYATFENNVTDEESYFPSEDGNYIDIAYVSESMSNGSGLFETKPSIVIDMEAPFTTMAFSLVFGNGIPSSFTITTYLDGVLVDSVSYDNDSKSTTCNRKWNKFDKAVITFDSTIEPYQRVYVNHISFGDITDYFVSFKEYLNETPIGKNVQRIKTLYVTSTKFTKLDVEEEVSSIEYDSSYSGLEEVITFDEPRHDLRVENATLVESGTYYVKLRYNNVSATTTAKVYGKKFNISYVNIAQIVNEKGAEEYFSNDLVDNIPQAKLLGEFIGSYVKESRDYEVSSWRGDPRVESNDIIYIENRFQPRMPFRVMVNKISYNTGVLTGYMKGRKVNVANTKNKLVVY